MIQHQIHVTALQQNVWQLAGGETSRSDLGSERVNQGTLNNKYNWNLGVSGVEG